MAIDVKPLLRVGTTAQAGALALSNVKLLNKKKLKSKDLIKAGMTNIIGIELIRAQGSIIETL